MIEQVELDVMLEEKMRDNKSYIKLTNIFANFSEKKLPENIKWQSKALLWRLVWKKTLNRPHLTVL